MVDSIKTYDIDTDHRRHNQYVPLKKKKKPKDDKKPEIIDDEKKEGKKLDVYT